VESREERGGKNKAMKLREHSSLFAIVAMSLAAVGIYGVMS
jgi:hypothetical protein